MYLKLNIEESSEYNDVTITIKCPLVDDELQKLIEQLRLYGFALQCRKDQNTYYIKPDEIFYVESVDDKTYVYCSNDVYRSDMRLFSIEEKLPSTVFVRIRKNCILNINYIKSFKSKMNGKIEALLENDERVEIARHYVSYLKDKLNATEGQK